MSCAVTCRTTNLQSFAIELDNFHLLPQQPIQDLQGQPKLHPY